MFYEKAFIKSPESVAAFVENVLEISTSTQEKFLVLTLSTKNEITGISVVTTGTVNASLVHAREVFQRAILNNATSVVLAHNHPSGDPKPSKEDNAMTKKLAAVGSILGIKVMDHIIIGDGEYFSYRESSDILG